ncbi:uncharacterized protein EI97DRAFT_414390 [Westerdykella ornata]|uniref:Calcineurin-like phosphoesterase domain-containing protein n=1 Tax=Westerdykella ornata TaxID=318751 RepID=A0A6A6JPS3_WESOR|nr:uncharacterized protein EI97DRAFT_414390 [Westerdykella ornata]KAF2278133.1 hypothetical protein EI97DRAFT_414390 [Westerdykella ornata]
MTAYDDYGMPVDAYGEPESLAHQAWRVARAFVLYRLKPRWNESRRRWRWRSILSVGRILIVIWLVALYYGERGVFKSSVASCEWERWENWHSDANPHRVVFIADPQLVDPHTYPGRPWPLNTLTVQFTDQYLRRTYSRIQQVLYPDTVIFLGDLFDGGREWSTRTSKSPEQQYRKYGDSFWLREYARFSNIFFAHFGDGGLDPRPGQPGRKIISSLPGNHDLGFGKGIQAAVRKRFNAYFGDGNRVDIIGNHTFVSLDSVSLSALGQANPESAEELWRPTVDFLDGVRRQKKRLAQEELRVRRGLKRTAPFPHHCIEADALAKAELPKLQDEAREFPTILLSHVPLYRDEGTPCGPLREHWPPTPPPKGQKEPLEKDDRNAIAVRGGYQYQNVLHREITKDLTEKIGNIGYAFSGDDHDYCEVVHRGYASAGGGIREITVKSISWAMGVRKPGVVLVSLWNPVDEQGNPVEKGLAAPTLQTHLCLLPDQLGIFIRYAMLFLLTLFVLIVRAALVASGRLSPKLEVGDAPLLPTIKPTPPAEKGSVESHQNGVSHTTTSSNSSATSDRGTLQVRNPNVRTRSTSPGGGYALPTSQSQYTYPLIQHAGYYGTDDGHDRGGNSKKEVKIWGTAGQQKRPRKKGVALFVHELSQSVLGVGAVVFAWYFWLIWRW